MSRCNRECQAKRQAADAERSANDQARNAQNQANAAQAQANNSTASASSAPRNISVSVRTRTKTTTVGDIVGGVGMGAAAFSLAASVDALNRGKSDSRIQKAGLSGLLGAGSVMAGVFSAIAAMVFGWRIIRAVVDTVFYLGAVIFNFTAIGVFIPHLLQLLLKAIIANLGVITANLIRLIMTIPVLTEVITETTTTNIQNSVSNLQTDVANKIKNGFSKSGFNQDDVNNLPVDPTKEQLIGFLENKFEQDYEKIKQDIKNTGIDIVGVISDLNAEESSEEIFNYLKKIEDVIKEIAIVSNSFNPFNDNPDTNILINASLVNDNIKRVTSVISDLEGVDYTQLEDAGTTGIFDQAKDLNIPVGLSETFSDLNKSVSDMFDEVRRGTQPREILDSIYPLYRRIMQEKINLIDSFLYINAITALLNDPDLKAKILDILRNALAGIKVNYKGFSSSYNTYFVYGYIGETGSDFIRQRLTDAMDELIILPDYINATSENKYLFVKTYLENIEEEVKEEYTNYTSTYIKVDGEFSVLFETNSDTLFDLENKIEQSIQVYKSDVINEYRKALTKNQLISYQSLGLEDDLNIDRFNRILKTHVNDLYVNAILLKISNFLDDKKDKKIRDKKEYLYEIVDMAIQSTFLNIRKYVKTTLEVASDEVDPATIAKNFISSNSANFFNGRPDEAIRRNLIGMEERINDIIFQDEVRDLV